MKLMNANRLINRLIVALLCVLVFCVIVYAIQLRQHSQHKSVDLTPLPVTSAVPSVQITDVKVVEEAALGTRTHKVTLQNVGTKPISWLRIRRNDNPDELRIMSDVAFVVGERGLFKPGDTYTVDITGDERTIVVAAVVYVNGTMEGEQAAGRELKHEAGQFGVCFAKFDAIQQANSNNGRNDQENVAALADAIAQDEQGKHIPGYDRCLMLFQRHAREQGASMESLKRVFTKVRGRLAQ